MSNANANSFQLPHWAKSRLPVTLELLSAAVLVN